MLIVYGKLNLRFNQGWVADYCHFCRGVRPFAIRAVRLVRHIYFVPVSFGIVTGHEGTCMDCGVTVDVPLDRYDSVSKEKPKDIETLIGETFRHIAWRYSQRIEDDRLLLHFGGDKLTEADVKQGIYELFDITRISFLARYEDTIMDRHATLAGIAALSFFVLTITIMPYFKGLIPETVGIVWILCMFFGFPGYFTYTILTLNPRHLKKVYLPALARALRPLKPSVEQVDEVLSHLRKTSERYKKINLKALMKAIEKPDNKGHFNPNLAKNPEQFYGAA